MYEEDLAYRFYLSDTLYYMGENEGRHLTKRFVDIRNDMRRLKSNVKEKTGDEIAQDIITRNGLNFNGCI